MAVNVLVVAHVFYPQCWGELAECIRSIGPSADVIVTYVDEEAVKAARRDFPKARFVCCENRGFDVWPFLRAVQAVDLAKYEFIVKLHTKRDIDPMLNFRFNRLRFVGSAWRDRLLSFCRTPDAWRATLRRLASPTVGMVAARDIIVRRCDVSRPDAVRAFDEAVREMAALGGRTIDVKKAQFVAGTMFVVRSEIVRFLLQRDFRVEMFTPSAHVKVDDLEYAHVVERMFGLAVSSCGSQIAAFDGSLFWYRLLRRFV